MLKFKTLNHFWQDQSGAVTVDWVVLTAAVIGLGGAVMTSVGAGSMDLAGDIKSSLTDTEIASYIPVTYGAVIATAYIDPGPRICQPMMMDADGNVSGGGCNINEQTVGKITIYQMSDDSQWRLEELTTITFLTDTQDSETTTTKTSTWYNADGDVVDAPDAT